MTAFFASSAEVSLNARLGPQRRTCIQDNTAPLIDSQGTGMNTKTSKTKLMPSSSIMAQLGYTNRAAFCEFIKREGLPFYRLGPRKFGFDQSEVNAWLESRKISGRAAR